MKEVVSTCVQAVTTSLHVMLQRGGKPSGPAEVALDEGAVERLVMSSCLFPFLAVQLSTASFSDMTSRQAARSLLITLLCTVHLRI